LVFKLHTTKVEGVFLHSLIKFAIFCRGHSGVLFEHLRKVLGIFKAQFIGYFADRKAGT